MFVAGRGLPAPVSRSKNINIEDENGDKDDREGNIEHSTFNIEHRNRAVLETGALRTST
jgi:hypothetical protein